MISFFIPGIPVPQMNRISGRGRFTRVHMKPRTEEWRNHVKYFSTQFRPKEPLSGPLQIELYFDMPRPKSLPKKIVHHIKKPDLDNLIKAVVDSLATARFFNNDSQFVRKVATKSYSGQPGVFVTLGPYLENK